MYNMEKIPTALELFQAGEFTKIQDVMIEFAKMHVEAALKEASEKAKITYEYSGNTGSEYCDEYVDKNSILNSYSLEKIQ